MKPAIVESVSYDDGVVYCDVSPIRINESHDNIPVLKPHSGFVAAPKEGQKVMMRSLDNGTRFITDVIAREGGTPDSMIEGEITIQLDEGTRVSFEKNNDGTHDLHLDASGDVYINGTVQ